MPETFAAMLFKVAAYKKALANFVNQQGVLDAVHNDLKKVEKDKKRGDKKQTTKTEKLWLENKCPELIASDFAKMYLAS